MANNYKKIRELESDKKTATVCLLISVEEKETKSGSKYCRLTLSDGETQIVANLWNTQKEQLLKKVEESTLVSVELYPKLYQGAMSYEVYKYSNAPADAVIDDYIIKAPIDSVAMYNEIITLTRKAHYSDSANQNPKRKSLVELVEKIYQDNYDRIIYWPAAKLVHHNFYGGFLYHTLRMVRSAYLLSRVYACDSELLLCGAALHDIGKIYELESNNLGAADYSIDGNLFGHTLIGIQMIERECINPVDGTCQYDTEKIRMLKHMIASHHGELEYGAITVPSIPEAMMLHEIDMIDSRMMQFEDTYKQLEPGEMSDKIFGLGTHVYKPTYRK